MLTGDFDTPQAKTLIEKYFAEIKPGKDLEKRTPMNVTLSQTKKLVFEDDYANIPALSLVYPTVESFNTDENALDMLMSLLASGKNSPMYKVLVEEKKLAPRVTAYHNSKELAGTAFISVTPFEGKTLEEVNAAIAEAFARFEQEGPNETEMQKLKITQETGFYNQMASSMNKAMLLAMGNELGGRPDIAVTEMEKYKNLKKEDILRVYHKYIKGKPFLGLSVVPKGKTNLALTGSQATSAIKESVADQSMKAQDGAIVDDSYPFTPSKIDRSKEPALLPNSPSFNQPQIWSKQLANGIQIQGISNHEIPMISFSLTLGGGKLFDTKGKEGTAYLTAALMKEGTAFRTPAQLATDIAMLGANISIYSNTTDIVINGNTLARNFSKVMEIVEEMILSPRYDENELKKLKESIKVQIKQNLVNPQAIGSMANSKLLFGADSPMAIPAYGTEKSLDAITLEEIKAHYNNYTTPQSAKFNIVGASSLKETEKALASLNKKWSGKELTCPTPYIARQASGNKIYFIDQPGAQQSYIIVSKRGPLYTNPDYFLCSIVNHALGSGSNGKLFDVLRLQKGYTYGAYSGFSANEYIGSFQASSSVQGSVTREAIDLFNDIIRTYGAEFTQEKLDATKEALIKERCARLETLNSKLNMLETISTYNQPQDYLLREEQMIKDITLEQFKELAAKHLKSDELIYLIIGDAKTQFPRFIGAELIQK